MYPFQSRSQYEDLLAKLSTLLGGYSSQDGLLSKADLGQVMKGLGWKWNLDQLDYLYGQVDQDGTGKLHAQELLKYIFKVLGEDVAADAEFKVHVSGAAGLICEWSGPRKVLVGEFKVAIRDAAKVHESEQSLVVGGEQLLDEATLADYSWDGCLHVMLVKTRRFAPNYVMLEQIGCGAFSLIYKCKSAFDDEVFAVKLMDENCEYSDSQRENCQNEAAVLAELDHPNIVRMHECFWEPQSVIIVMEFGVGSDLIWRIEEHGPYHTCEIAPLFKQMAAAIHYLHALLIIYRDVKNDNYLCDRTNLLDSGCRVFLCDFGTAVHLTPGQRLSDSVGTKVYWAPERFREDYSFKADVWGLGVGLFGLLDGRFPFPQSAITDLNRPAELKATMPTVIHDLIGCILHKVEAERYSIEQLACHEYLTWSNASKQQTSNNEVAEKAPEASSNVAEEKASEVTLPDDL